MARDRNPVVATYSIAACDLDAGHWGVATQSKFLAVGSVVPWAEPGVGAIATQAYANPRYGPDGLALLRDGLERAGGGRPADGRRRRPRPAPGRRRRRTRRQRELHRRRVHGLGRRDHRALLRRAGKHPRRRGDGRGARGDVRRHGRPAARRAPARVPRGRPGCRRRPPRPAVGGAARRRARRRLRPAQRRCSSTCASTTTSSPSPSSHGSTACIRCSSARRRARRGSRSTTSCARELGERLAGPRLRRRRSSARSRAWAGTENLEERVDGVERIDPVVLAELRAR